MENVSIRLDHTNVFVKQDLEVTGLSVKMWMNAKKAQIYVIKLVLIFTVAIDVHVLKDLFYYQIIGK